MKTIHKSVLTASMTAIFSLSVLTACHPRNEPVNDQDSKPKAAEVKAETIPLIESKAVAMTLTKPEACDAEGCTRYSIQTVETNVDWIDEYFSDRIRKADPIAFSTAPNEKVNLSEGANPGLSQSTTSVRYISQSGKIATFALESYTYTAGAAHGMSHVEYINFDLKAKKRLALQDILTKGADSKVLSALYDSNSMWLEEHNIERSKLQLSDNFYYGASGIVFVYPLYELASYAEGMTELKLPYHMVEALFKPEYLPNLPHYENQ